MVKIVAAEADRQDGTVERHLKKNRCFEGNNHPTNKESSKVKKVKNITRSVLQTYSLVVSMESEGGPFGNLDEG